MTLPVIGYFELGLAMAPLLLVALLFRRWSLPVRDVFVASARMLIQLLLIGYILIYIFANDHWLPGILIMSVMLLISAWIALRPLQRKNGRHLLQLTLGLLAGSGSILILLLWPVLQLEPWYQPRYVIPLAGMLLANTMNALSLAGERFDTELDHKGSPDQARRSALNTAMIPQINSLLAVGLVALPGMMTGQILSGVSPLIAVRYQIVIMAAIFSSSAFSVAIYLLLRLRQGSPS